LIMAVCTRCGKALHSPSGVLSAYTNRGLAWLVIVTITVSLMVIGMAMGTLASLFESGLPYTWKLALMLTFGAIMVFVIVFSMTRALEAIRLSHYCSDCVTILTAERSSRPEEFGAHKVRMKKA
jgi:uncharacterized membrane protein